MSAVRLSFEDLEGEAAQVRRNQRMRDQARLDTAMAEELAARRIRERSGIPDPLGWTTAAKRVLWVFGMAALLYVLVCGVFLLGGH